MDIAASPSLNEGAPSAAGTAAPAWHRRGSWLADVSLARKIVIVIMGVSGVALVLACATLLVYDRAATRSRLTRDVGMLADVVGANSTAALLFGDATAAGETLAAVSVNKNVRMAALIRDGAVFARYDRVPDTAQLSIPSRIPSDALRAPLPISNYDADTLRVLRPIALDGEVVGAVYVESGLGELSDRLHQLLTMMGLVMAGSAIVAFVLSSRLQRLISGPILRLTDVTRAVSRDRNYGLRVAHAGRDEVGTLIDGFNEMLSEIQRRDRRLMQHQDALEREVTVRTADLLAMNAELTTARDAAMDASRAKGEFLANISHELRTPMNGIIGMTELALQSHPTSEQRECLDTVRLSAGALLTLLNDILDFSKIESRNLELESIPFSVAEAMKRTVKPLALLADRKGLELVASVDPAIPAALLGDPGRLGQVIANLASNAIKFTERGHIALHVRLVGMGGDAALLQFFVTDTGIGIPADKHAQIFEAFRQADGSTTRRFGGTGLGLTISSTLVAMMGGRIVVESTPGHGSTFHFTIALPAPGGDAAAEESPVRSGARALVVDDSEAARQALVSMLTRWRMHVSEAATVDAALLMLAEARRSGGPFDVLLVDGGMHDADGVDAAARLAAHPDTGGAGMVLLMTSRQLGDERRCDTPDRRACLTKPIWPDDLRVALLDTVRNHAPRPTTPAHAPASPAAPRRVLLVEDNRVNQRVAAGLLEKRGHTVEIANNGVEALAALAASTYDAVLMDIQMPEMGGVEATRHIRDREAGSSHHTHIIAMTAHAMKGDREHYLGLGMDGYLTKPVDRLALIAEVEAAPATGTPAAATVAVESEVHACP